MTVEQLMNELSKLPQNVDVTIAKIETSEAGGTWRNTFDIQYVSLDHGEVILNIEES